jgi:hypothetical protein
MVKVQDRVKVLNNRYSCITLPTTTLSAYGLHPGKIIEIILQPSSLEVRALPDRKQNLKDILKECKNRELPAWDLKRPKSLSDGLIKWL